MNIILFFSIVLNLILFLALYHNWHIANIDTLTKLKSFSRFTKDFKNYFSKSKKMFFLILIDLDNLKSINDLKGHINGNNALIELSSNLLKQFPNSYRIGGDEFAIISFEDKKDIMKKLSNLTSLSIKFSYGIVESSKYISTTELFDMADKLMYEQKRCHKKS